MTVVATRARPVLVSEVMSAPTVTVAPTMSVWSAWSILLQSGLRHLVVAAGDQCSGVIDDRTLFAEWTSGPTAMRHRKVRELLPPCTTCVSPDSEIQMVARAMARGSTDAVPVVDRDGRLVGIVTGSDVVRAVATSGIWTEELS
jgi:CBS domain-containing protein